MEVLLKQIITNTAPKNKMAISVKGTNTRIVTHLNPPIELDREKNMKWLLGVSKRIILFQTSMPIEIRLSGL